MKKLYLLTHMTHRKNRTSIRFAALCFFLTTTPCIFPSLSASDRKKQQHKQTEKSPFQRAEVWGTAIVTGAIIALAIYLFRNNREIPNHNNSNNSEAEEIDPVIIVLDDNKKDNKEKPSVVIPPPKKKKIIPPKEIKKKKEVNNKEPSIVNNPFKVVSPPAIKKKKEVQSQQSDKAKMKLEQETPIQELDDSTLECLICKEDVNEAKYQGGKQAERAYITNCCKPKGTAICAPCAEKEYYIKDLDALSSLMSPEEKEMVKNQKDKEMRCPLCQSAEIDLSAYTLEEAIRMLKALRSSKEPKAH